MLTTRLRLAFVGAGIAAALAGASLPAAAAAPALPIAQGTITGVALPPQAAGESPMNGYLGIRYATTTRWQPPAVVPLAGNVNAQTFAPPCAQNPGPFGRAPGADDCTFLNVYTPSYTPRFARLPVMVWFHGGGFTSGEAQDYNPDRLVRGGAIVVTVDYRLGLFGLFLIDPLSGETHPDGNYGIMDQQAALAWVKTNIARFGGDPNRVTIFGQSAGGLSVAAHLVSPASSGLFSRAIMQSGSYGFGFTPAATFGGFESQLLAPLASACGGTVSATCLRALPAATILALSSVLSALNALPIIDGQIITQSATTAFATGSFAHVPIINGTNHDEYRFFVAEQFDATTAPETAAGLSALANAEFGPLAPLVLGHYPAAAYGSPDLQLAGIGTDEGFACPALAADVALSSHDSLRGLAYAYEFADESAPDELVAPLPGHALTFALQAAHGSELPYLFDTFGGPLPLDPPFTPLTPTQRVLAQQMVNAWTSFAATGQPNTYTNPLWLPFGTPLVGSVQSLASPIAREQIATLSTDHQCAFWAQAAALAPSVTTLSPKARMASRLRIGSMRR